METSGYGMVAQESRNDGQILLLHLEMYRTFNKYINHPITAVRAVTKLVKSLYYYCHTNLSPGSTPA